MFKDDIKALARRYLKPSDWRNTGRYEWRTLKEVPGYQLTGLCEELVNMENAEGETRWEVLLNHHGTPITKLEPMY